MGLVRGRLADLSSTIRWCWIYPAQMVPAWRNWQTCLPAGRRTGLNMYYVYALESLERKYIYVGLTNNIERRTKQHQNGKERTTAVYRPFKLIFKKGFSTRVEARKREKYLKSGIGKEFLKGLK